MEAVLSIAIGLLFAAGVYMILRRSVIKLVIGLALVGHAANLLIFTSAGLRRGEPPLLTAAQVAAGDKALPATAGDPLPPALILTAIVISFGIVSFAAVLVKRAYQELGTDDVNLMRETDRS